MKVLVVSDTHLGPETLDRMPPEVWEMAEEADAVLHAGDVVHSAVLEALSERAPLHAVLGNNDHGLRATLPEVLTLELEGVRIGMIHDAGSANGRGDRLRRRFPDADMVVCGHSHDPIIEQVAGGPLLVNPGSPTQRRRQPVHTVGWLDLVDGRVARAELDEVGPFAPVRSTGS